MYLLDKRVRFLLSFASQNGSSMLLTLNLNYMYMHMTHEGGCVLYGAVVERVVHCLLSPPF